MIFVFDNWLLKHENGLKKTKNRTRFMLMVITRCFYFKFLFWKVHTDKGAPISILLLFCGPFEPGDLSTWRWWWWYSLKTHSIHITLCPCSILCYSPTQTVISSKWWPYLIDEPCKSFVNGRWGLCSFFFFVDVKLADYFLSSSKVAKSCSYILLFVHTWHSFFRAENISS